MVLNIQPANPFDVDRSKKCINSQLENNSIIITASDKIN